MDRRSRTAVIIRSSGDAAIGLTRDPRQPDRMAPVLTLIDDQGRFVKIELTALDVKHLHDDAGKLLSATSEQVLRWWTELTGIAPLADADAAPDADTPADVPTADCAASAVPS